MKEVLISRTRHNRHVVYVAIVDGTRIADTSLPAVRQMIRLVEPRAVILLDWLAGCHPRMLSSRVLREQVARFEALGAGLHHDEFLVMIRYKEILEHRAATANKQE